MPYLKRRGWVPEAAENRVQEIADLARGMDSGEIETRIHALAQENRAIHELECINLNPATNTMNPRAEAFLAAGLGARPSLGYPGDKYETGLEAIEEIEVICAELAAEVFGASHAEVRVPSGAMANLYAFMATCAPGDTVIVPPASIGGHVTHNRAGAAGLYGLEIVEAPVDAERYTVDVAALSALAEARRPKLITIGSSLNLTHHPVAAMREVADAVGAKLLFDAAHLSGPIAGGMWPNPLAEGAHLMTMSTYKSLGGPPGGLIVTGDAEMAERLDRIAFPGLTANFDAGRVAALAITLLDWREDGRAYAAEMLVTAQALARALQAEGVPVYGGGATASHQFAVEAARWGGGQALARRMRHANLLACGIGLPIAPVEGDMNGLRIGTTETARWGMGAADMPELASLIARALKDRPETVAQDATGFRQRFRSLRFIR